MATINRETAKQLAESPEMNNFYRVLAIKHSNSIQRVLDRGGNAEAITKRAKKEIKLLLETERIIEADPEVQDHKCPRGEIWDAGQGVCVPIEIILE